MPPFTPGETTKTRDARQQSPKPLNHRVEGPYMKNFNLLFLLSLYFCIDNALYPLCLFVFVSITPSPRLKIFFALCTKTTLIGFFVL